MSLRSALASLAALSVVVLVAGCGGGGSGGGSDGLESSSISKAEFVSQLNSVCSEEEARMGNTLLGYQSSHPSVPPKRAAKAAVQAGALPALGAQLEEVHSLGAPSGGLAKVEAFTHAVEDAMRQIKRTEPATFSALIHVLAPIGAPATAYGLVECDYATS